MGRTAILRHRWDVMGGMGVFGMGYRVDDMEKFFSNVFM